MEFKVGDQVIGEGFDDEIGTVVSTKGILIKYGVEYKTYHYMRHNLGGLCGYGRGYWFNENQLRLAEERKPLIKASREYTVGSTVKVKGTDIQGLVVDKGKKESVILTDDKFHIVDNDKCFVEIREVQHIVQTEKVEIVKPQNFKVGEWVRIRDWDDMAAEFYTEMNVGIRTPICGFVNEMRPLCGMYMHISSIDSGRVWFDNRLNDVNQVFLFDLSMIEPIPDYKVGDKVRVRTIEDIEHNFGGLYTPYIPLGCGIMPHMERICGELATIKGIGDSVLLNNGYYVSKLLIERVK